MSELIRQAIKKIASTEGVEMYGVPCTFDSFDESALECDCTPINGDAPFIGVRLQASTGNGLLLIPRIGSIVIVQPINDYTGYIAMVSQVDRIQFLNGEYGGLVKIEDLILKLNTIEGDLNDIKQAFLSWTPVAQDGGAALKTATSTWASSIIAETQREELENDNITHGEL